MSVSERVAALRALAGLIRTGVPIRGAIELWPEYLDGDLRASLRRSARLIKLGAPLEQALRAAAAIGTDVDALIVLLEIHASTGGDVASMLESFALDVEERAAQEESARSATAGASLSGKVVAALPLAFLPLTPAARAPLMDPLGGAIALAGLALVFVGLRWMSRLVPRPDLETDPASLVAGVARAALRGGAGLSASLSTIASHAPATIDEPMAVAGRLVRLGSSWSEALARSQSAPLRDLARSLALADRLGMSAEAALEAFVAARRSARASGFEQATKRAQVRMVFPLVSCILPAYLLLAFAPFVRASI